MLTTSDAFERSLLIAVILKAIEMREHQDDRLALAFINRLAESMGGD